MKKETPAQVLMILNDPPYNERTYSGLHLALALEKSDPATTVTVFLMADAVVGKTPSGYYNVKHMLKGALGSSRNW